MRGSVSIFGPNAFSTRSAMSGDCAAPGKSNQRGTPGAEAANQVGAADPFQARLEALRQLREAAKSR